MKKIHENEPLSAQKMQAKMGQKPSHNSENKR